MEQQSHGTHVLDLATGGGFNWSRTMKNYKNWRIIAVNLSVSRKAIGMTGNIPGVYASKAIGMGCRIRRLRFGQKALWEKDPMAGFALGFNLSYGPAGGP